MIIHVLVLPTSIEGDGVALREDVGDWFQDELTFELLVVGEANGGDVNHLVTQQPPLAYSTVDVVEVKHHSGVVASGAFADLYAGAFVDYEVGGHLRGGNFEENLRGNSQSC